MQKIDLSSRLFYAIIVCKLLFYKLDISASVKCTLFDLSIFSFVPDIILGLQKFKLKTANSVITKDNSSLSSMATDQVFDLFSLDEANDINDTSGIKVETILKGSLNSIPSPSPSVKNQIMGGNICLFPKIC